MITSSAMTSTLGANPRRTKHLANDPYILEVSSDCESPGADANIRKASAKKASKVKKNKKKQGNSKPEIAMVKATANRNRIMKAIEAAASHLSSIGSAEDVADWLDKNGFTDKEDLQTLHRACAATSTLLKAKTSPVNAEGGVLENELDQYYVFRSSSNSAMLLTPMVSLRCKSNYSSKKALGLLRRRGEGFPLAVAFPGWKSCAEQHKILLDSATWSDYVLEFAQHFGYEFPPDGFDEYHGKPKGASFASHVEPKLMLFHACQLLTKRMGEKFDLRRLWRLQDLETKIEPEIVISEAPCLSCEKFRGLIKAITGLKFTFKVCQNLGVLKSFRNSRGQKRYPQFAEAEDGQEDDHQHDHQHDHEDNQEDGREDDEEHRYPLQPKSPNLMVVIKSNMGLPGNNTTKVQVTQTQLRSLKKKHSSSGIERTSRKKRQYEDSDDNEDYKEPQPRHQSHIPDTRTNIPAPQTRSSKRAGSGLVSPTPSPDSHSRSSNKKYGNVGSDMTESTSYSRGTYGGKRVKWT